MQKTVVITNEQIKRFYKTKLRESVSVKPVIVNQVKSFLDKEGFRPEYYDDIDENGNLVKRVCINALGKVSKQPMQKHSFDEMIKLMDANEKLHSLISNDKDRIEIFKEILNHWINGTIGWDGMLKN